VSGDRLGLRLARRRASSRFGVARVTCCGPRLNSIGWLTGSISPFSRAGAGSDDASPVLASPLRRHTSSRHIACASTSLARDRPLAPKQSADVGTTGEPVTTGLVRTFLGGSGTSPEVCFPSAYVSRVASYPQGGRPCGRSRFGVARVARPRTAGAIPGSNLGHGGAIRPCGFSHALRRTTQWHGSNGGRSGWVVRSSPTCAMRLSAPRASRIRRSRRRDSRRHRSVVRVGSA